MILSLCSTASVHPCSGHTGILTGAFSKRREERAHARTPEKHLLSDTSSPRPQRTLDNECFRRAEGHRCAVPREALVHSPAHPLAMVMQNTEESVLALDPPPCLQMLMLLRLSTQAWVMYKEKKFVHFMVLTSLSLSQLQLPRASGCFTPWWEL